jgi:DNA ligase (NAD+)
MYTQDKEKTFIKLSEKLLNLNENGGISSDYLQDLRDALVYHEWKYYVQNSPVISDYEYDQLYKALEKLEQDNPALIVAGSPTQRVSSDLTSDFKSVSHLSPMLSLANSYDAEDLIAFDESIKKILAIAADQLVTYCVEPKYDGGSIALIYDHDILVRAATRGNGQEGDEMTPNARTIKSIPLQARFSEYGIGRIELRGEAIIRKDIFEKINLDREQEGLPIFANPRNAATGGLRMKDPSETAQRGIQAFIYQIAYVENLAGEAESTLIQTQWGSMELLEKLGFKVPTVEKKRCNGIKEVIDFCHAWQIKRDDYPYEIDGMVVKLDDVALQTRAGATSHHPRWAIAYKFKAKQATTRLLAVEYQVGKVGSITPVAKVKPVQLAGVTVSSISLHNEEFIKNKDLRLGDQVLIERAGDVIPYIVKAIPEVRDGSEQPIVFPIYCPINKKEKVKLVREAEEAAWRCPDCSCGAQDLQRIVFHVSKEAMNIDGLGRSIIERFWEEGWVHDVADLYQLDYDKVAALEGFGARSAQKLKASIDRAKKNPLHRLLHSLSVHHLGKKASKLLAERVTHALELGSMSEEELTSIKDIGPVLAKQVIRYFNDPQTLDMLRRMELAGVNLHQTEKDKPKAVPADAPLAGKTILFTGTLEKLGRKEAQQYAEDLGAKVLSAVSSKLDILVVGENAGSKLAKARALGTVAIYTETEFLKLTGQ